jgi:hypothetical protein
VFEEWQSDPEYPTLFRVDRDVVVSTAEALPSSSRKLAGQPPAWIKAFGLRIEPQMPGRQIAWVRRSNGGWLAVVLVPAASGNGRSSLTIPLWLDPSMVSTDRES